MLHDADGWEFENERHADTSFIQEERGRKLLEPEEISLAEVAVIVREIIKLRHLACVSRAWTVLECCDGRDSSVQK